MTRLVTSLLAALTLLALACGTGRNDAAPAAGDKAGSDAEALTKVTLMLDWTPNTNHAGIYVAHRNGWYREAGLDLAIVEPASGGARQVVGAGRADFGITVAESLLPARAASVPIVSIAAILPSNDSSLMTLDPSITRPRDLAGKKYGGFGGQLERELITQLVTCDGGDASTVQFVDVGNVDYIVGMDDKRFDFVWVFEGWDVIRAREVLNRNVNSIKFADYLRCIPDWYTPLFITNEQTIRDRPDVVRKFLQATARGYELAQREPAQSANLLLQAAPELDRKLVEASASYLAPKYAKPGQKWGTQDAKIWKDFEEFLRKSKLLEKEVDTTKTFTNDFLPR